MSSISRELVQSLVRGLAVMYTVTEALLVLLACLEVEAEVPEGTHSAETGNEVHLCCVMNADGRDLDQARMPPKSQRWVKLGQANASSREEKHRCAHAPTINVTAAGRQTAAVLIARSLYAYKSVLGPRGGSEVMNIERRKQLRWTLRVSPALRCA